MSEQHDQHDDVAKRITEPLRAPVHADATFAPRVMSAVHAEVRSRSRSWWLRPREFRLAPIASLALAAGLAAVMFAGGATFSDSRRDGAARDTVHVVRFVLVDTAATSVTLVGGFNQWHKKATPLHGAGSRGVWVVDLVLPAGRHEYAFVVQDVTGERWLADPFAEWRLDEFDTESSVISVGRARVSS